MAAPMASNRFVCNFCQKFRRKWNVQYIHLRRRASTWQGVVGLEIHAQISSDSKLFSGAATMYGAPTNTQVAFLDAALPGTLPVLNRRCVEAGVLTALALGCEISKVSKFDRKHYFYADLPAGYQITQQRQPIARGGHVDYVIYKFGQNNKPKVRKASLVQLQLEQDSGKSLHDEEGNQSLIDLNRAGIGLMEIVTTPDFTTGEEAEAFVHELRRILMKVGTCDGKMAEGSLRVDANISVHKPGDPLGTRTEVKNLNSTRSVRKAIEYEVTRQIEVLKKGGEVVNETRSFDVDTSETVPMRDKERQQDYRFMPEPNLPPLHVYTGRDLPPHVDPNSVVVIDKLKARLPPLPAESRSRLQEQYGLSLEQVTRLAAGDGLVECFEALVSERDPARLCNFVLNYDAILSGKEMSASDSPISISSLDQVFDMFTSQFISMEYMHKLLVKLLEDPHIEPKQFVIENNWSQVMDKDLIREACVKVLEEDPGLITAYRKGKKKVLNAMIGRVMTRFDRRAHQRIVYRTFKDLLSEQDK